MFCSAVLRTNAFIFLLVSVCAISGSAFGCICVDKTNSVPIRVHHDFERAEIVVIAKAIKVYKSVKDHPEYYVLEIQRVFKGPVRPHQTLKFLLEDSCDYAFEAGKQYLVYARSEEDHAKLIECAHSNLLDKTRPQLEYLEKESRGSGRRMK